MKDGMEALTLGCLETMKEAFLPGIAEQMKARDKALEIHNGKSGKILELDKEIDTLAPRCREAPGIGGQVRREQGLHRKDRDPEKKISARREIREEIEANILPEAAKQLEDVNHAVSDAVLPLLEELCDEETERIRVMLKGTDRVNAYNDSLVDFQQFLSLPFDKVLKSYTGI